MLSESHHHLPESLIIYPAISGLPFSGTGSPDGHVAVQHGGHRSMTCLGGAAEQPVSREYTPHCYGTIDSLQGALLTTGDQCLMGPAPHPSFVIN